MRRYLLFIIFFLTAFPAGAQEIYLLGGEVLQVGSDEDSYSWQMEYREGLGEHLAASLSYLNEGHLPGHHRDGISTELWARQSFFDRRLSLAVGIGPYYYLDTNNGAANGSFRNEHGWGGITSLAATWYTDTPLLFQLRTNWVFGAGSVETLSAVAGIGCQLETPPSPGPLPRATPQQELTTRHELTLFAGQTIVNSFNSQRSVAMGFEYRRGLLRYLDATVGWLYEGDNRLLRRDGLTAQLWGVREFFHGRLALGVGGGGYFALDHYADTAFEKGESRVLSAIATFTGSYRIDPQWQLRTSWNRIVTNYNRDTDVILAGVGFRF